MITNDLREQGIIALFLFFYIDFQIIPLNEMFTPLIILPLFLKVDCGFFITTIIKVTLSPYLSSPIYANKTTQPILG